VITVRTNLPEFKSKLNALSGNLQKRIVRDATRAAGRVIQQAAKANAPVRPANVRRTVPKTNQLIPPGVLKASIAVVTKRSPKGAIVMMVIPRSGKKTRKGKGSNYLRDAYYWAWAEQGHVIATTRLKGGARSRGLQRARLKAAGRVTRPSWYLRRAFASGQSRAVAAFYEQLDKSFAKYAPS